MSSWISRESGALAWLVLVVAVAAYVAVYDVWAYRTGHRMMTTQFRLWLHETVAGPVIAGLWIGVFVALSFHFLVKGRKAP